jgi:hypothetical protein
MGEGEISPDCGVSEPTTIARHASADLHVAPSPLGSLPDTVQPQLTKSAGGGDFMIPYVLVVCHDSPLLIAIRERSGLTGISRVYPMV